jgi:hypothetical protein
MKRLKPIILAVLSMATWAQTPTPIELGALFVEDTIKSGAEVCKKRYPASQEAWIVALDAWHSRNQASLDKLHDLAVQLEKRYEEQATGSFGRLPSPLLGLYLQSIALPLSSFAAANDSEAKSMCDRLQAALTSDQFNILNIDRVTKAAESILARPAP